MQEQQLQASYTVLCQMQSLLAHAVVSLQHGLVQQSRSVPSMLAPFNEDILPRDEEEDIDPQEVFAEQDEEERAGEESVVIRPLLPLIKRRSQHIQRKPLHCMQLVHLLDCHRHRSHLELLHRGKDAEVRVSSSQKACVEQAPLDSCIEDIVLFGGHHAKRDLSENCAARIYFAARELLP